MNSFSTKMRKQLDTGVSYAEGESGATGIPQESVNVDPLPESTEAVEVTQQVRPDTKIHQDELTKLLADEEGNDHSLDFLTARDENDAFVKAASKNAKRLVKYAGAALGRGSDEVVSNVDGAKVQSGEMTLDEYKIRHSETEKQRRRSMYIDAVEDSWGLPDWAKWGAQVPRVAIETLPLLGAIGAGGVTGGVTGASTGAALGAVAGAGPTPASTVTVPAGAAGGYAVGQASGSFYTLATIMSGGQYIKLRDMGISHDIASHNAAASGILEATLFNLRWKAMKGLFSKSAIAARQGVAAKSVVTPNIMQQMQRFLGDTVKMGGLTGLAEIVHITNEYVSKVESGTAQIPTQKEMLESAARIAESFSGGVQGAIGGAGVSKALGVAYSEAAKYSSPIAKHLDGMIRDYENAQRRKETERMLGAVDKKFDDIAAGNRPQIQYTQRTQAQLNTITSNPQQYLDAVNRQITQDVDTVLDGLNGGTSKNTGAPLESFPLWRKGLISLGRTGTVVTVPLFGIPLPVPIPQQLALKNLGWSSFKNKLLQFAPKDHAARDILDTTNTNLAADLNADIMRQEFVDAITDLGNPTLVETIAAGKHRSWVAKEATKEFNEFVKQNPAPAGSKLAKVYAKTAELLNQSDDKRMQWWAHTQHPKLHKGLVAANVDPTFSGQWLEKSLRPDQKGIVVRGKAQYQNYSPRVNEMSTVLLGKELLNDPDYSGKVERRGVTHSEDPFTDTESVVPGSFEDRQDSHLPIEVNSGFVENMLSNVSRLEDFAARAHQRKMLHEFFNRDDVREAVVSKFGKKFYDAAKRKAKLDMGFRGGMDLEAIDKLMGRTASIQLMGNAIQFPKQLTAGLTTYLAYTSPQRLGEAALHIAKDSPEFQEYKRLSKSRYIRGKGHTPEMRALQEEGGTTSDARQMFDKVMQSPMRTSDAIASTTGSMALYLDALARKKSAPEAAEIADRITTQTQSSSIASERTLLEQEGGTVGKMWNYLGKQGTQSKNQVEDSIRAAVNNPTRENVTHALRMTAAFKAANIAFTGITATSALGVALANGNAEDFDNALLNMFSQSYYQTMYGISNEFPIVRDLMFALHATEVNAVASLAGAKAKAWDSLQSTPIYDTGKLMVSTVPLMIHFVHDFDKNNDGALAADSLEALHVYFRTVGAMLPTKYGGGVAVDNAVQFARHALVSNIKARNGGKLR